MKNLNLNSRKKVQFITESCISSQKCPQTSLFNNKLDFFFFKFKFKFSFLFASQLRMTILDYCISLKMIKNLVVSGVVDMRQLLLNTHIKGAS